MALEMATGLPGATSYGIPNTGVGEISGVLVAVNRLKGVSVGIDVEVGRGVKVVVGSSVGIGVQVAGRTLRGVEVTVGKASVGGKVGGGNGLKDE